jgi:hypothetical protein
LAREAKKNREIWRKLRLVVIHSTKLYIPLSANKSPFNLGLRPFNSDQVQDWAKRQGQDWSGEDAQQLTGFVNRNTYLVRVALYHIGRGDVTLEQVLQNTPIWPEFMAIAYNDNCGTYNSSQSCWQHSCEC